MVRVLLVYDIGEERLVKVHNICRRYLYWVQNSVFEGELTRGKLKRLIEDLEKVMDPERDSVVIYTFKGKNLMGRIHYGSASLPDQFIF